MPFLLLYGVHPAMALRYTRLSLKTSPPNNSTSQDSKSAIRQQTRYS